MKTIHEAIKAFLFHCHYEKKLSSKTMKAYELDCKQFLNFLNQEKLAKELTLIDKHSIKSYLHHLKDVKPKTLRRKVATLKTMFNFLEFEDEILINPFRKMRIQIKEPKMLPKVMTLVEVKKILSHAQSEVGSEEYNIRSVRYKERARNQAILELMFATGMRVSEVCCLRPEDVDLKSGQIRIMGKGSRQRIIQICHEAVLHSLSKYETMFFKQARKKGCFFLNRRKSKLSEQSIRIMISKYSKKAGVEKHITPHTFRHSFATLLLEQDVDIKYIQQFLGHSSINTTQIYTHVNANKQKEILSVKHPRLLIAL
ncbi:MAG: tyrosine-type recombinase/integrase [Bacteroidetes bacterium]|nr:tyrosine-type recombinase/integrase [Bacteroidota bacterium]